MEKITDTTNERTTGLTVESGLYLLALLVALVMRLVILGQHPLSEHEAGFAWQALQVARGDGLVMVSHPAYIQMTAGLFILLGSGDVLARILPAVVGSAVVLLPYMLRERIGHKAALVAAFGLALDPISIAISRQAGSPAIALGFLAVAWFLWDRNQYAASGFFAGLLTMSGTSFVYGLVSGLVGYVILRLIFRIEIEFKLDPEQRRSLMIGTGVALLLVGTLFTIEMQGIAAALQAIPDFFAGWLRLCGAERLCMAGVDRLAVLPADGTALCPSGVVQPPVRE